MSSTKIEVGKASFDLAGVGGWINDHVWLFLLFAFISFIFFIFRKGAFAERFLDYRLRKQDLDVRQLDATRELADRLRRQYDRDEPLLPFDSPSDLKK